MNGSMAAVKNSPIIAIADYFNFSVDRGLRSKPTVVYIHFQKDFSEFGLELNCKYK